MTSSTARACVLLTATAVVGLAAPGTASAHVGADAPDATPGGYSVVTFRVPTESATASTTGVTVALPPDAALASASAEQLAGWSSTVGTAPHGTPASVTWTADAGAGVEPGQFGLFAISVGPLPQASSLTFDTTQTYSDGSSVDWNEPPNADGSEPEHPVPEITLTAATTGASGDTTDPAVTAPVAPAASTGVAAASSSSDTTARWLGAGGLLLGALGLGLGGGAAVRSRRVDR